MVVFESIPTQMNGNGAGVRTCAVLNIADCVAGTFLIGICPFGVVDVGIDTCHVHTDLLHFTPDIAPLGLGGDCFLPDGSVGGILCYGAGDSGIPAAPDKALPGGGAVKLGRCCAGRQSAVGLIGEGRAVHTIGVGNGVSCGGQILSAAYGDGCLRIFGRVERDIERCAARCLGHILIEDKTPVTQHFRILMITNLDFVVQHPAGRIVRFEVGGDGAADIISSEGTPFYLHRYSNRLFGMKACVAVVKRCVRTGKAQIKGHI